MFVLIRFVPAQHFSCRSRPQGKASHSPFKQRGFQDDRSSTNVLVSSSDCLQEEDGGIVVTSRDLPMDTEDRGPRQSQEHLKRRGPGR